VPKARGILAISEHTKRDLVELGVPPKKVTVTLLGPPTVSQPLEPKKRQEILGQMGLKEGFFLYIGNLKPFKNVPRLIRVYRQWAESKPAYPPLILAGRNFMRDLKDQLGGTQAVRWVGEVSAEQLMALYQGAKVFVFPSLYEGFGLPPLEAMSYGTPVLCSNRASLPEVVGDAAFLVDPEDDAALRHGLERMYQDDALCAELSKKGRIQAARFSWEKTAQQTLGAYRKYFS
jgi:alpha-1,3-rhamnosyl/mannosyltransferase